IFEDLFKDEPPDPVEAARRTMRSQGRRRFYKDVGVAEAAGVFSLMLDGRSVRTPARHILAAPARAIAESMAEEWRAQEEHVDPAMMPLTRLANAIVDGVAAAPGPVADEIKKYLASDLVFYRAATPDGLVALQSEAWDPIVEWARDALGARFVLVEGVSFVP